MLWTTPENVENFERKKLSELGKNLNITETTKLTSVFFNCETLNDISLNKDLDGKAHVPQTFWHKSHSPPSYHPPTSSQEWPFNKVHTWDLKTALELLIQSLLFPLPVLPVLEAISNTCKHEQEVKNKLWSKN